jgi:hypothetical protein
MPHGLFGGDARVARGADAQVLVHEAAIRVRQLAVDVRGDELIDVLTIGHVSLQSPVLSLSVVSFQSSAAIGG